MKDTVAKIKYSQAAEQDLEQIGDYIAMELKSPMAALNTVNRVQDVIDKLKKAPRIGSPLSARYENAGDYRFLVSGNYLVFYREQSDIIYIDRILYGKRDYMRILFGEFCEEENE